ncbi:MAG: hypothetical protein M3301_07325 [Chloroflexota bacterium]|nr:hypothetical protein [Chloroflexota bacterium]
MTEAEDSRRNTGAEDTTSNYPTEAPEPDELELELAGERPRAEQAAYVDRTDVDSLGEGLGHVEMYEGELEAGVHDDLPGERPEDNLELLTELELRAGETDNPDVAAEEGMTYVPPIDPPVVASEDRQGAEIASGFGLSALDEPYDEDHHSDFLTTEDEMAARVRDALRADSTTTEYADRLAIGTRGRVVRVRGVVEDIDDSDNVLAVIERVAGVEDVIDELEVRALE